MINSGCVSKSDQAIKWHYSGETSLNSPSPISSYVEITQQKLDGINDEYVTCEKRDCPTYIKKSLDKDAYNQTRIAVFVDH